MAWEYIEESEEWEHKENKWRVYKDRRTATKNSIWDFKIWFSSTALLKTQHSIQSLLFDRQTVALRGLYLLIEIA